MIGKVELTENRFRIYRGKWVSITYWVSLSAAFLVAGIVMLMLGIEDDDAFVSFMGLLFSIVGLLAILNLPHYKRIMKHNGDVALEVSKEGVSISPVINERMVSFPWRYISGVAVVTTGRTTTAMQHGEWGVGFSKQIYARKKGLLYTKEARQRNLVIIFLRLGSDWEKIAKGIWRAENVGHTPKGQRFLCVQFPDCSQVRIVQPFRKFSNDAVDVNYWHRIHFNYRTNDEEYIP